jgi:hypothetical protein
VQLGTLGTLTLTQIGDGLSKEEIITIKVGHTPGYNLFTNLLHRWHLHVPCPSVPTLVYQPWLCCGQHDAKQPVEHLQAYKQGYCKEE